VRSRFSPGQLLFFLFLLAFLMAVVQFGLLSIAFGKLGLSQTSAYLLLISSLLGSSVNVPVATIRAEHPPEGSLPPAVRGLLRHFQMPFTGRTTIAVNLGGCLIPLTFSLYLVRHHPLTIVSVGLATVCVALVCNRFSRPVAGIGIGIPIFVAPLTAAIVAMLIDPAQSAPLAYISGTLGVLIGADLLRINDIRKMGVPIASIGGAGTFDGIFLTGIVAVLLA